VTKDSSIGVEEKRRETTQKREKRRRKRHRGRAIPGDSLKSSSLQEKRRRGSGNVELWKNKPEKKERKATQGGEREVRQNTKKDILLSLRPLALWGKNSHR